MSLVDRVADRIADRLTSEERPARRRPTLANCPRCGATSDRRVESCGFGAQRSLICGVCGYLFQPEE